MASLSRCYYDTICTHGPALDCARETFGAERLMFGTDEPHRLEDPADILAALAGRGWPQAELGNVLGENARQVFGL